MNLPEGWPTPEMIEAAKDARLTIPEETLPGKTCRIIFEAMLAAAPTPPTQDIEPYTNAIATLRCLSVDENLSEGWRDRADRAANELADALDRMNDPTPR